MIYLLLNKGDWNLLDLTAGFYDITSLGKVGISSETVEKGTVIGHFSVK
jgi:hypothetical protein